MSNERIDEFLSWRGRLDDPDGVPGQGLDDREATWERLMDKIGETPRRRRFFGYRLAAACVLLALIPAARLFHHQHARIASSRPIAIRRAVLPAPTPAPLPAPVAMAPSVARGEKPLSQDQHEPQSRPVPQGRPEHSAGQMTGHERSVGQVLPALHEQSVQLADLPSSPIAAPAILSDSGVNHTIANPLKNKPLRVVHINELPGGAGPSPAVTVSDARRHFEIFLIPSQSLLALPPPPPAADPALLKVKLTSSN